MLCILGRVTRVVFKPLLGWCSVFALLFPTPCLESAKPNSPTELSEFSETKPVATSSGYALYRSEERAQHLKLLGVDHWQEAGYRGQGVKVAILDSGFRGYRHFLGNILPPRVVTASFRSDSDLEARESQHGIFCGE